MNKLKFLKNIFLIIAFKEIIWKKNKFKIKQKVKIIRHKHGWVNGAIEGNILTINFRPTGTAFYKVLGNDGLEYHILKSKDIKAI